MPAAGYFRQILALEDAELERFIRDWVSLKRQMYREIQRFSGSQDLGRDVVGFITSQRHEGAWHNFQCKQYSKSRVPLNSALIELAKIFYHSDAGQFTLPTNYFFVAPHGLSRKLELLLDKPSEFRDYFIANWNKVCARKLSEGKNLLLTNQIRAAIEQYNFGNVRRITLEEILADDRIDLVLHRYFGADPGPAPTGKVPDDIQQSETVYISQLIAAYGQRAGKAILCATEVAHMPEHSKHLARQRERFFDADYFKRHYRDNTEPHALPNLDKEIYHGIADVCDQEHRDKLCCVDAVMSQAASIRPSGPLSQHARISVKQGICHHLVNEGLIKWQK